ncbi:MAG: TadE/TadG family type IV pilus assembly protein [Nocardioidaceae bacterium]
MKPPHDAAEDGTTFLELGLVSPVLAIVIAAVLQYGYLYWSVETASATAYRTAQALMIGTDWSCTSERARTAVHGPATGTEDPVVERRFHHEDGTVFAGPVQGALVTVTVSFRTLDVRVPFLPLPDDGRVSRSVTARVENVPRVPLPCV